MYCANKNGNMSLSSLSFMFFFSLSSFTKPETLKPFFSHFQPLPPPTPHKPTNCNSHKPNPPPLFCIHTVQITKNQTHPPKQIHQHFQHHSKSFYIYIYIYNKLKKIKKKEIPEKITLQNPQLQAQKAHLNPIKHKSQLKSKPSAIIA